MGGSVSPVHVGSCRDSVHRARMDVHPLVDQLRFTRSEFLSGVRGVSADDARSASGA